MPSPRALLPFALTLAANACHAQEAPACQEHKLFGDERRFECALDWTAQGTPPRFVALFSGGHDDTMASLKVQVDGKQAPCGPGSKPELMAEDGDVSLLCQLPVAALAAGRHVFTVDLRWSHARYEGFRLER